MEDQYSDQLKELMALIVSGQPKPQILARAKEIKIQLSRAWTELQRVIGLLDGMVAQYAPDKEWHPGFWLPSSNLTQDIMIRSGFIPPRPPTLTSIRRPPAFSVVASPEHIDGIAHKLAKDGVVHSNDIIRQLRTEGDSRPEKDLAIGIGNVLIRRGWQHMATGIYRVKSQQPLEAKSTEVR